MLSNGLLSYEQDFEPIEGYYSVSSVFLSISILSLLRAKTISQSTDLPVGELGRAIGLDRIPEVKTLRERIALFCQQCDVELWAGKLSNDWMGNQSDLSGILYIDGHVNIYYGKKTKMPKRYVSRMRLCMRGSTDYWVNDHLGQPFFVINKVINDSMAKTIIEDIIPTLNEQIPNQPEELYLTENPKLHRYMLVFDRECSNANFFYDLWHNNRIAICTYKKNVKDKWDENEFKNYKSKLPNGEEVEIQLAERSVSLKCTGKKKTISVREIRKKSENGHQTSIVTTNYTLDLVMIAYYMFSRWSQENFFKYMMQNFGIDNIISYSKRKISDTSILVNPEYRELDRRLKSIVSKLNIRKAKFAAMILGEIPTDEKKNEKYLSNKAKICEEIKDLEQDVNEIKSKKKAINRKIPFSDLPDDEKFDSAINERKSFMNTIKMIAYRAETSMVNIIRKHMSHPKEARKLLQQLYKTDANLKVDKNNNILTVELHHMNYWKDDKIIQKLCEEINLTETKFPGTNLTLFYKMVSF